MKEEARITEAEIANLVDHFYAKVRQDDRDRPSLQ